MDLKHVTILIPAHNRPERLRRLLNYYVRTNINIIVADSSNNIFPYIEEYPSVNYQHFPDAQFLKKIYDVLPCIDTPYVVFCADDDFIVPEAIGRITSFLDQHTDYVTAQGHFLTFEVDKKKNINFYPRYIRNFNKQMKADTAKGRLEEYKNLYASILYSVCRTKVFKQMYADTVTSEGDLKFKNLYLAEEYFNLYTLIHGKHITLPVFYAAREQIEGSAATVTTPLQVIMNSPEYENEYAGFIRILADQLTVMDKIDDTFSYDILTTLMKKHIHSKSFKSKLIELLSKHPFFRNIFDKRYKNKGIKAVQGMESYPYNKITPEKKAIIDAINS